MLFDYVQDDGRVNFRAPNGNRRANAFGTITSTYDPRILQVGVTLSF